MTHNSNDDIAMETLENQISLETLDHLIITLSKKYVKVRKNAQMKTVSLSTLTKLWKIQN